MVPLGKDGDLGAIPARNLRPAPFFLRNFYDIHPLIHDVWVDCVDYTTLL